MRPACTGSLLYPAAGMPRGRAGRGSTRPGLANSSGQQAVRREGPRARARLARRAGRRRACCSTTSGRARARRRRCRARAWRRTCLRRRWTTRCWARSTAWRAARSAAGRASAATWARRCRRAAPWAAAAGSRSEREWERRGAGAGFARRSRLAVLRRPYVCGVFGRAAAPVLRSQGCQNEKDHARPCRSGKARCDPRRQA